MKIEKFKGNGEKLFDLMEDIVSKVKDNSPLEDGISEQNLATKFFNFFADKITNISNILKDYSSFVLDKEKETGMTDFSLVSQSHVDKIIAESKATKC